MDTRVKPAYDADVLKLPDRSAADAVLDHPGSQQPVARRAVVPAVVGIFPDLRADAAGGPDAWGVLHARHLFCRRSIAFLRRPQSLGHRARRWINRRSPRRTVRAA